MIKIHRACAVLASSALLCAALFPSDAEAERTALRPVSPALALGRVFVAESGWHGVSDQHGIMAVFARRLSRAAPAAVRRLPYPRQVVWIAKQYAPRSFTPEQVKPFQRSSERTKRQRWVNGLSPACEEPPEWKAGNVLPWRLYRSRCETVFSRAKTFLEGKEKGSCYASRPVDHWGGPMDDKQALRRGWKQLKFGCFEDGKEHTPYNHFWCNPSISDCNDASTEAAL